MLLELTEGERQIILYSKLRYEWHVLAQDMSVIVGDVYGIDCMEISTHSVYRYVVDLYEKLHRSGFIRASMTDFVSELFQRSDELLNYEKVMRKLLIAIQGVSVQLESGLAMEIGDPNEKLLPLRKENR